LSFEGILLQRYTLGVVDELLPFDRRPRAHGRRHLGRGAAVDLEEHLPRRVGRFGRRRNSFLSDFILGG
jgi:hypothetical protein